MANIKKYDCVQLCAERGLTYLREKNPHVWFIDLHGIHHKVNRYDFAKSNHVGSIRTCLCSKEEYFLNKLKQRYPNRFDNLDFTNFRYYNATTLTDVSCKTHGTYKTKPNWLMNGVGCVKCTTEKDSIRKTYNLQEFINKSQAVHFGYYEYHKTNYTGCRNKLTITCKEHGILILYLITIYKVQDALFAQPLVDIQELNTLKLALVVLVYI